MAAYPRKQTVAIFILCAFAVGGVGYYVYGQSKPGPIALTTQEAATLSAVSDSLGKNSDWQKQFLGATASSTSYKLTSKPAESLEPEDLTATDLFSRSFFTKYVELRQRGASTDPDAVMNAVNETIAENIGGLPLPKTYTVVDVKITGDSQASLAAYKNTVSVAVNDYSSHDDGSLIAMDAFEKGDSSKLTAIDPIIQSYKTTLSRLLATPVPQSLVDQQVLLLNGFSMALYSAQSFRDLETNPIQALVGVKLAALSLDTIGSAYTAISTH